MAPFRLFDIERERLETFNLDDHPPYLAASHTWSENVFPQNCSFSECFAGQGMKAVVKERHPTIKHCWFDTVCIDQADEQDKLNQIPLMDRIFGEAECVVVFISAHIGATQQDVDWLTAKLDGALAMCQAEAWKEEGAYWQSAEGRRWLLLGEQHLLRLASTAWATRIWTLQEYVLARSILWIGRDLLPIQVDDYVISALPDICNTLAIEECLVPEFRVLDSHFAGMANARLQIIDRTRIMELPGNRKATVPVDEVYGCMAASGVILSPTSGETKADAWARWCEEAVRQGHIRWILLPATLGSVLHGEQRNCVLPPFASRHDISGCSGLDRVEPLGQPMVSEGCVAATARMVGSARILRRLGHIHEPEHGTIHRDITLILFAGGSWTLALKLVWAFGGGRYNTRQARVIAQVLVQSYARAVRTVTCHKEKAFRPVLSSNFQQFVWNDFLVLQQSRMLPVNVGEAYLCELMMPRAGNLKCYTVIVVGQTPPKSSLHALDFEAQASDGRLVLMVVEPASLRDGTKSFHKVGMTLGISEEVARLWADIPHQSVKIGGFGCSGCRDILPDLVSDVSGSDAKAQSSRELRLASRIRLMERHQERARFKLFAGLTDPKVKSNLKMSLRAKNLRYALERCQTRFPKLMKALRQSEFRHCLPWARIAET